MFLNKIHKVKIESIHINMCDNTTHIIYYIRYQNTVYNSKDFKFYKTKQEIINYLNEE